MTTSNRSLTSEDVYGEKWDRCLTDTTIKIGLNFYCTYMLMLILSNCSFGSCFGYCFFGCSFQTYVLHLYLKTKMNYNLFLTKTRSSMASFLGYGNRFRNGI